MLRRPLDTGQQLLCHPFHDGLQDRVLGGEVPEQRPLRQVHVAGNRCSGDVARVLGGGQLNDGLHGGGATLVGRQVFGSSRHGRF
jgi:hypothetical protein